MPLLWPCLLIALIVVVCTAVVARRPDAEATSAEQRARVHLRRARAVALVAATAVFVVAVMLVGSLGQGWFAAPALAGAAAALVVFVGERSVPSEPDERRTAALEARSPARVVTPLTRVLAGGSLAASVGLVAWSCVTASSDDAGRGGRAVEWSTREGSQRHSPWPGSFYAWPVGISLVLLVVCVAGALAATARRGQVNADARSALIDGALRRDSVAFVLRVTLCALAVTLAGVGFVIGGATAERLHGTPAWVGVLHWTSRAALVLALVTALAAIRPVRQNGGMGGEAR